jgi:sugar diacid utilization regulator
MWQVASGIGVLQAIAICNGRHRTVRKLQRRGRNLQPVVALGDLSSLECALISSDSTVKAMIMSKGAELKALPSEELAMVKATVRAFAASDLNVNRAATALFVHANTVRYRLGRIAEATGYDPRAFAGLVELVCLLDTLDEDDQVDHNGPARDSAADGPGVSAAH